MLVDHKKRLTAMTVYRWLASIFVVFLDKTEVA